MRSLQGWIASVTKSVEGVASELVDIGAPGDSATAAALAGNGFPGALPLWSYDLLVVALLPVPGADPASWPVIIVQDGEALTVASDTATLLPRYIVLRLLSNVPDSTERLAEHWSEIAGDLSALHEALGGTPGTMEPIISVLRDPVSRLRFKYRKARARDFEAAHSELLRAIDPSEPFQRFAGWLDACIDGECSALQPHTYGSWGRRSVYLSVQFSDPPALAEQWVRGAVERYAGIDSGIPSTPSWDVQPGATPGEYASFAAAERLEESGNSDELTAAIVRSLVTERNAYRGLAHAEAVPVLDERGEPERAWGVLHSAAWWSARNPGGMPKAILDGAHLLARGHRWHDIEWALSYSEGNS